VENSSLSLKHPQLKGAFKKAAGKNKIPDFGSWLQHPALTSVLPNSKPTFDDCHKKRLIAEVAHATIKKTGQFTRPLGYKEAQRIAALLRGAYRELLVVLSTL
jgi:hypothetical protein